MNRRALLCLVLAGCGGAGKPGAPAGDTDNRLVMTAPYEAPDSLAGQLDRRLALLGAEDVAVNVAGTRVVAGWNKGPSPDAASASLTAVGGFQVVAVASELQKQLLKKFVKEEVGKTLPDGVEARHFGVTGHLVPTLTAADPTVLQPLLPDAPDGTRWVSERTDDLPPRYSMYLLQREPILTSADLTSGTIEGKSQQGPNRMKLRLSAAGRARFHKATGGLVGGLICVVVEDRIWSCPAVMSPISTDEIAVVVPDDLADPAAIIPALVAGPLPVRLTVVR